MVSAETRVACAFARGLAVLAAGALLAGCGAPRASLAEGVCQGARQSAARALGVPLSARVVSPQASDLECLLAGGPARLTVISQAGPRAYTEFDTEVTHQDQVFGPGIHEPAQIPVVITVPGSVAAVWIPAQALLVATNATPTTAGAYVTVAITGPAPQAALRAATAAARATFAAHPNGDRG